MAKGNTLPVNIEAELKKRAAAIKDKIQAPTGNFIRVTQDKKFVTPDGAEGTGPLNLVILDFVAVNAFYDRPFKQGDVTPAACMAIGESPRGMKPLEESPNKQSEECDKCPNNQFGSKGAGKACSNGRLLAVVQPTDDEKSPIWLLKVSPTALKAFDGYVASLQTQFNTVPVAMETQVYFDPTLTYASLRFGEPKPNKNIAVHFNRLEEAKQILTTVPDFSQYEAPKPGKRK